MCAGVACLGTRPSFVSCVLVLLVLVPDPHLFHELCFLSSSLESAWQQMVAELEAEEEIHRSGGLVSEYRHVIVDPLFVSGVGGGGGEESGGGYAMVDLQYVSGIRRGCGGQVCVAVNERNVWG